MAGRRLASRAMTTPLNPVRLADRQAEFASAQPFPHVIIDNYIDLAAARDIAAEYPTFESARTLGFSFDAVNERKKIQITDQTRFPSACLLYTSDAADDLLCV